MSMIEVPPSRKPTLLQRILDRTGVTKALARNMESTRLSNGYFAPGDPPTPQAGPDFRPRQEDYRVGYNINIQPRNDEPVSFWDLFMLAENDNITRLLIETRKDQVAALDWDIKVKDKEKDQVPTADQQTRIQACLDFFDSPDDEHSFEDWVRMLLEDVLVFDAPCVYVNLDDPLRTKFQIVSGMTITRKIDENGRTPHPPEVAYQQIVHGTVAASFTSDEMIYKPRNPRPNRIYGMSPVQQIILTVNIALRKQMSQLYFFTEGTIPDALISVPEQWTPKQIQDFQNAWDNMLQGNLQQKRHAQFVPGGTKIEMTKAAVLTDEADLWFTKVRCYAFSIPPTAFEARTNRATAQTAKDAASEEGLAPLMNWLKSFIDICLQKHLGQYDLEFGWVQDEVQNPTEQVPVLDTQLRNGTLTINEFRKQMGRESIGPDGDIPMVYTATGPILLKHVINPPAPGEPGGPPALTDGSDGPPGNGGKGGGQNGKKTPPSQQPRGEGSSATGKDQPAKKGRHGASLALLKGDGKKTLYIHRPLLNAAEFLDWAKAQGFSQTLQPGDLHVTQAFSREPLDWDMTGAAPAKVTVSHGMREVAALGDKGAVVLKFSSLQLQNRFQQLENAGASWDHPGYVPHITITYQGGGMNLDDVEPFDGVLEFGPEVYSEVVEDWEKKIKEEAPQGTEEDTGVAEKGARPFVLPLSVSSDKSALTVTKAHVRPHISGRRFEPSKKGKVFDAARAAIEKEVLAIFKVMAADVARQLRAYKPKAAEAEILKGFNEDQPRDDHGRWSAEGGGSGFSKATPEAFIAARDKSARPEFLSTHTPGELADHSLYLSADGKVGYALDNQGDVQNVFNNGGPKGAGSRAVLAAVQNGGRTLDCYDGKLPEIYSQMGFVPSARMAFNDAYAPAGWDYTAYGRPDVVFMSYQGGDRGTIAERVGSFPAYDKTAGRVFTDYGEAQSFARSQAMAKYRSAGRSVVAGTPDRNSRGRQFLEDLGKAERTSGVLPQLLKADPADLNSYLTVDISQLDTLANGDLPQHLSSTYTTAGLTTLGIVGARYGEDVVNQVNERALEFARNRSAELVGMKWVNGELVDNPNAEWSITQSTRDMLNQTILEGLDNGLGVDGLADAIMAMPTDEADMGAFTQFRARMIARTETIAAHAAGDAQGLRQAAATGLHVQKEWYADKEACDDCLANMDQGPIELDDVFESGDSEPPAHPNCECSLNGVTDDEGSTAADDSVDAARRAYLFKVLQIENLMKYSEAEERDDKGKWTAGGEVHSDHQEKPVASVKRASDFKETGHYDVTVAGETRQIYRDPENGWWYQSPTGVPSGENHFIYLTLGFNKNEAVERVTEWILTGKRKPVSKAWAALRKYSEDQERDDRGRWTNGGMGEGVSPSTVGGLDRQATLATMKTTAAQLNYPYGKMGVSDQDKTFELNGTSYKYAGSCDKNGNITLYTNALTPEAVQGVLAHEIEHGKFFSVMDSYAAEKNQFLADPSEPDKYMKMDGTIRPELQSEFAGKYPYMAAIDPEVNPKYTATAMAKDDGVTPYSRDWWASWKVGDATTSQAFHETLAEMARLDYENGNTEGASSRWKSYYNSVNRLYAKKTRT